MSPSISRFKLHRNGHVCPFRGHLWVCAAGAFLSIDFSSFTETKPNKVVLVELLIPKC